MGTGEVTFRTDGGSVSEGQPVFDPERGEAAEDTVAMVVNGAMEATGLAAYCWTIADDALLWSPNAAAMLEAAPDAIRSGRRYASLLDPAAGTTRFEAVMAGGADAGDGVPFQTEYLFRPGGRGQPHGLWIEDKGRWFAGPHGRPERILGTIRRIDERDRREQPGTLGLCDPQNGIMNRPGMREALRRSIAEAAAEPSSCALLLAAIGNLSVVNEAYGFDIAEQVMAEAGQRLGRVVRAGDTIARFSGSKFGLILHRCNEDDLAAAAERFLAALRESVVMTEAGPVWALLSIGAVVLPRHASDPATAITRAEEALAQARKQPFDGFAIYQPSRERLSERVSNARFGSILVRCLKEGRLRLAFQPVIDPQTRVPVFHEGLLRVADHAGEALPADRLVAVAEKLGLVRLIDQAVVELAVAALNTHPGARISINISGTTATDPRWYPEITAILARNGEAAQRLIVEITETVALGDLQDTTRFVRQLKDLGVMVAIDDFGAGYTSFRNLRAMPIDMLKIDGTFCRDLAANADNRYFVRALIDLARAFGLKTVAEWVETEADAELLCGWGIDMMQGKLFGEAETLLSWPMVEDMPPPAEETLASFADQLEGELAGLRRARALLDRAFAPQRRGSG
jgi:diguanylate cyclase (GGDEF)-like protein